jgi:outer membrane protein insertion porin family
VAGYNYGLTVVNANLELRTPYLLRWVGLVGFVDAGYMGVDSQLYAYGYSTGLGIRVKTPIGPVRLDWGKRLRNPPERDIGRFYLGLLHAF